MRNKTYLVDYDFYGDTYQFEVVADDAEEVQRRIFAIKGTARYAGELYISVPVPTIVERIWYWLRGSR